MLSQYFMTPTPVDDLACRGDTDCEKIVCHCCFPLTIVSWKQKDFVRRNPQLVVSSNILIKIGAFGCLINQWINSNSNICFAMGVSTIGPNHGLPERVASTRWETGDCVANTSSRD